jgi:hypothetical protein
MKKKSIVSVVTFVSGVILGVGALVLLSFTGVVTSQGISKISIQEAQANFNRYYQTATPTNQVIKGFAINKDQLDAMNRLSVENPNLAGFRLYMGLDNNSAAMGIIVGIDNTGKDNTASIYKASASVSGPCPTICDQSSSIIVK